MTLVALDLEVHIHLHLVSAFADASPMTRRKEAVPPPPVGGACARIRFRQRPRSKRLGKPTAPRPTTTRYRRSAKSLNIKETRWRPSVKYAGHGAPYGVFNTALAAAIARFVSHTQPANHQAPPHEYKTTKGNPHAAPPPGAAQPVPMRWQHIPRPTARHRGTLRAPKQQRCPKEGPMARRHVAATA